ncbi:MAG: hypothetical protein DHS80DRAFT_30342 [Piptocephalis tieghemiana]|nr:MAG: hypothetical protein DHS80DRAFT_30342 [Piptocephalis tieghemiana]
MRASLSLLATTVTCGTLLLSQGASALSITGRIVPFADDVADTSAKCITSIKSLPTLFPNINRCFPVSGFSMASPAAACGMDLTQPKDCLNTVIKASQHIASSCDTGSTKATSLAPYSPKDIYRNWSNQKAVTAACAKEGSRPCLNVLTDMVLAVLPYNNRPIPKSVSDKICSSKCTSDYYLAVNGFINLAPTVYLAEGIRQNLFDALRSSCSWAHTSAKSSEVNWLKEQKYPECEAPATKPTSALMALRPFLKPYGLCASDAPQMVGHLGGVGEMHNELWCEYGKSNRSHLYFHTCKNQ